MNIGDHVTVVADSAYNNVIGKHYYRAGDKGIVVGSYPVDVVYVRFDQDSQAVLDNCNHNWAISHPGDVGVWAVETRNLISLEDEITTLQGTEFVPGAIWGDAPVRKDWVPDEAVDDVMDITKGMFE